MSKLITSSDIIWKLPSSIKATEGQPICADEIFTDIKTLNDFVTSTASYEGQRVSLVTTGTSGNYEIKHYTISNNTYKPLINAASCGIITIDEENKININNLNNSEKMIFCFDGGLFRISSGDIRTIFSEIDIAVPNGSGVQYSIGSTLKNIRDIEIKGENGLTGSGKISDYKAITISHAALSETVLVGTAGNDYLPTFTVDDYGHITKIDYTNENMKNPTYKTIVTNSSTGITPEKNLTNGNVFLNTIKTTNSNTSMSSINIKGEGGVEVKANDNSDIIIKRSRSC